MKTLRIILSGKLRSGKDTIAELLIKLAKEKNICLEHKKLAEPLYKAAKELYKKYDLNWRKNRRLLEGIGDAFNFDNPNGKDKIIELFDKEIYNPNEDFIITDMRKFSQYNYFKEKDTVMIRVECERDRRKARCKPGEWAEGHPSDTELDNAKFDYIIYNNGSLEELTEQVYDLFNIIIDRSVLD